MITDSKLSFTEIGNMRAFLERLQRAGENFDVADLESKTALVLRRNDELMKGVAAQKKAFQAYFFPPPYIFLIKYLVKAQVENNYNLEFASNCSALSGRQEEEVCFQELKSDVKVMAGNIDSALLGHHKELSTVAANSVSRDQASSPLLYHPLISLFFDPPTELL